MNSHPNNSYQLDAKFNGSYNSFPNYHQYHHPGLTTTTTTSSSVGVPVASASIPSSIMYKVSPQDELKKRLTQGHLSYLNRDDTPEKLAHKTKLEGLIVEYLSVVPHTAKFENIEVAECFDTSIIENKDFTACRAAAAFEVLEKYATNLLTKPWRKEFRTILPYGGYMKGLVDKQLCGVSKILYLMGYRKENINGVTIYSAEPTFIDPDTLARVSLDCLIAFVECQMMIQIADALKRKGVTVNWLQILDIRVNSICSMDQLVNFVLDSNNVQKLIDFDVDLTNIHNMDFNKNQSHLSGHGKLYHYQQQPVQYHHNGCPALRDSKRKRDLTVTSSSSSTSNDIHPVGSNSNLDNSHTRDLMNFSLDEPKHPTVYYYGIHTPSGYIAPPARFAREFSNVTSLSSYPDTHYHNSHHVSSLPSHYPLQPPLPHSSSSSSVATNYNLAQTSYNDYNKNDFDIIDGGLSSLSLKSNPPKIKSLDRRKEPQIGSSSVSGYELDRSDEPRQLTVENTINLANDSAKNMNTNVVVCNSNNNINNIISPNNVNNSVNKKLDERISSILKSFANEEKMRRPNIADDPSDRRTRTESFNTAERKLSESIGRVQLEPRNKLLPSNERIIPIVKENNRKTTWSCAYCTFLNTNQDDICDMCSRSKEKPGQPEMGNLVSGGRVCSVCTLVNAKDADNCSACENSLQDSPTYI